jgi:hypothetical protein
MSNLALACYIPYCFILLDLIPKIVLGEKYKKRSSKLWNFLHPPSIFFVVGSVYCLCSLYLYMFIVLVLPVFVLVYVHCTICAVLCDLVRCMCCFLLECMFLCKHCHRAKAQLQLSKYIYNTLCGLSDESSNFKVGGRNQWLDCEVLTYLNRYLTFMKIIEGRSKVGNTVA